MGRNVASNGYKPITKIITNQKGKKEKMKVKDCALCYANDSIIITLKESRKNWRYYLIKYDEKTKVPFDFIKYEKIVYYFSELSEDILESEVLSIFAQDEGVIEIIANKE